jgi:pyridine nucleotide-disulfide oxidoreductase domain-containing protein 1
MAWRHVVVGGGIAGYTCASTLAKRSSEQVLLVTCHPILKGVKMLRPLTKLLQDVTLRNITAAEVGKLYPNIVIWNDEMTRLLPETSEIELKSGRRVHFQQCCLAMGAAPVLIGNGQRNIIGLRDDVSVDHFQSAWEASSSIMVVGNGGIALELMSAWVRELKAAEKESSSSSSSSPSQRVRRKEKCIYWVIRENHIGNTFFDPSAAAFLIPELESYVKIRRSCHVVELKEKEKEKEKEKDEEKKDNEGTSTKKAGNGMMMEVTLSDGEVLLVDYVVSATGVHPRTFSCPTAMLGPTGGIEVDAMGRSRSFSCIFAAGDCADADALARCMPLGGSGNRGSLWFPLRTWGQGKTMGEQCARCMLDTPDEALTYSIFAHVTEFFEWKVVLLGLFDGRQPLHWDETIAPWSIRVLVSIVDGEYYVRVTLHEGRVVGAVLIGETDLEDTMENLILSGLDVSALGDDLLNPDFDLSDYFD